VTTYRCSGCGVINRAINDLTGMAHTRTGGKPSGCQGTYRPVAERLEGAGGGGAAGVRLSAVRPAVVP
jgi:hypothetical protein